MRHRARLLPVEPAEELGEPGLRPRVQEDGRSAFGPESAFGPGGFANGRTGAGARPPAARLPIEGVVQPDGDLLERRGLSAALHARATGSGGVVWGRDSRFFYYVERDENHRPLKVFRHLLGTRQEDDRLVYEEKDTGWFVTIGRSASGRFCVVSGGDHDTSEQRLLDLGDADAEPRLVEPRQKGVRYEVADRGEELYVLTNRDDAIDFRIDVAPLAAPGRANWRPVVPHRPGTYILDLIVPAGHLARLERSNALPSIAIRDLADGQEHTIAFDEQAYALDMIAGYEFDTTTLRFAYSSMTTPAETWDYDMASRQRTLRKRQQIPSGHNPARYVTTRLLARAADGAEVPVSLLHRRGLVLDGTAPLLLYGYGSYGMAMPASFSANRLSLVDRGFVYAIAHIRGGSDKGWGWYLDGKREKKANTFDDFIAVARALIDRRYTSAARIVAHGGSAGGMLMGAVANRAGELFAGIVSEVPFVDVLNTMLDDTLPLTPPEWPEWGNPITDPAAFRYIRSYSPYDNVAAQRYPAILAMGGFNLLAARVFGALAHLNVRLISQGGSQLNLGLVVAQRARRGQGPQGRT